MLRLPLMECKFLEGGSVTAWYHSTCRHRTVTGSSARIGDKVVMTRAYVSQAQPHAVPGLDVLHREEGCARIVITLSSFP
jgi:hypothetical protein